MEQFQKKFIEEATDLINDLEKAVLSLANDLSDKSLVEQIFRIMHTIKGNSDMFGFHEIDRFTHQLETIYDNIRNDKLKVTDKLVNLTLTSVDHLRMLLDEGNELSGPTKKQHEDLVSEFKKIAEGNTKEAEKAENPKEEKDDHNVKVYHVQLDPDEEIFKDGTNLIYLLDELCSLGSCKMCAHFDRIPGIEEIEAEKSYTYWDIMVATDKGMDSIIDVFIFIDDKCNIEINEVADYNALNDDNFVEYLETICKKGDSFNTNEIHNKAFELKPVEVKTKETTKQTKQGNGASKANAISSIRVASEKLDDLMNMVSELVTTQARLNLFAEQDDNHELAAITENMEKISRRLRDTAFSIRLIPIENIIPRFQRLVRELSQEFKKEIVFESEGADTELDKTIIESLADPLMHIIRNSIDHGIESPEVREKMGKNKQGKLKIRSYYSGTNVHIEVSDDGAGIDLEKIQEKAIEKELISEDANLSDNEILRLVFLPGFSTATEVTNVSGRGVGMDVVKRKISDIRGEVDIETELGKGTSITIKLPLTLSIIDGLLVKIDNTYFVIPLSAVNKVYDHKHEDLMKAVNNLVLADEDWVPFLYLREIFEIDATPPELEQVIVVEYNDMRMGLAVDTVVGEYQAVLKSLGRMYKDQDFISGSTILGDGTVALVMDTNKIINKFSSQTIKI